MSNIRKAQEALVARVLKGDGRASHALRRAAFDNVGLEEPLLKLLRKVAERAHTVTDEDVAAVRAAGLSEDQIFELVVCAAIGEASRQHDAALGALHAAAGRK